MEVFIPHQKDRNIYLDEIITYSSNQFVFGNYKEYNNSYKIVNIQFPEAIFDWLIPTGEQLDDFKLNLKKWKLTSKIVYTMNDFQKHYDNNQDFYNLFKLIHQYADGVIHLGQYSLNNYKDYFLSNCKHVVIYHPLYVSLINEYQTKDIQEKVSISLKDKFIVSAIGGIRSKEEARMIIKIFKKIPLKNKILIVPRMVLFVEIPDYIPCRFRKYYRKIVERIYTYPLSKNEFHFSFSFLEYEYLINLIQKTSLMIIPRIKNLNSGNLFLGLTFDKPMVIPKIGNLTEVANFLNLPILDLQKNNYNELIDRILNDKSNLYNSIDYFTKKKRFHPENIALNYDKFFNLIVSSN